jgi:hypothetical protein
LEDGVTTTEFYYLLLVLGAFGAFAVGMSLATMQHKAWLRRQAAASVAVSGGPGKDVGRARRANRLADAA